MRVLQVEAVSSVRDNYDLKVLCVWKVVDRRCRDGGVVCRWCKAVAATVWNVTVTGDDQRGSSEVVDAASFSANGEKLPNSNGLASGCSKSEDSRVKLPGGKEVSLDAGCRGGSQIAVREGGKRSNRVSLHKVASKLKEWHEGAILRETSKRDAVRKGWVHGSQGVRVLRSSVSA